MFQSRHPPETHVMQPKFWMQGHKEVARLALTSAEVSISCLLSWFLLWRFSAELLLYVLGCTSGTAFNPCHGPMPLRSLSAADSKPRHMGR